MDHDFHGMLGNPQIGKNLGDALDHCFGMFLAETFPYVHMDDWHLLPPNGRLAALPPMQPSY